MILVAWVHLLAAVAWIGGMLFLSVVLVPVLRREGLTGDRRTLFQVLAVRFRLIVWPSIMLLLATGPILLTFRNEPLFEPWAWPWLLKLKMGFVALLVSLTGLHDFWLGPYVARQERVTAGHSGSPRALSARIIPWIGRAVLVLGLVVLGLGVAVARM